MTARSPFGETAVSILTALAYAVVAVVWILGGGTDWAPGRWVPVHLFTLGVLTNLILVFSEHFGRTLTRQPAERIRWQPPVLNTGILALVVGLPMGATWLVAAGAIVVTAVVLVAYWRLRRMRRAAVGARFVWIVRIYERAHGAFVHGAILGALMGTGVLAGGWYGSARVAHLHVNVLGWGGLTLLATLVFFGPTIVRTRIEPGADDRAARALRRGATGLTAGVVLLLTAAVGGAVGDVLRVLAAVGIAVFAWAVTVSCLPVARAASRAKPSATRWPVVMLTTWFPLVAWTDVAVVATGSWRYLDALGLAAILGVLVQAIATVLTYLASMLRGRSPGDRDLVIARLERGASVRVVAFNAAVLAVTLSAVVGTAAGGLGTVLARGGWLVLALVLLQQLGAGLWRLDPVADARAVEAVEAHHGQLAH